MRRRRGQLPGQGRDGLRGPCRRHAVAKQILDATPRLAGEQHGDLFIDDAGPGADGVGGMRLRTIAFRSASGDAGRADARSARPKGETETTVTGSGAASAVNRPARPAPTTTMPPFPPGAERPSTGLSLRNIERSARGSMAEIDHALDRGAGRTGDSRIDGHLLFPHDEGRGSSAA
jgi:hypothetical protein